MRRFLMLLILSPLFCFSQDTVIKYTEVIRVDSASKDQLYQRGRSWFNENFKNSKDVLQIQDKETGELSGKGSFETYFIWRYMGEHKTFVTANFSVNIYVKDGRYKYEISNINLTDYNVRPTHDYPILTTSTRFPEDIPMISEKREDDLWSEMKKGADIKLRPLIDGLKIAMSKTVGLDF